MLFTKLSVNHTPLPSPMFHSFCHYNCIDIDSFLADLQCSRLITDPPKSLRSLPIAYNTTLSSLIDKHAPVTSLNLYLGPLLLSVPLNLLFVMLKTSGNATTLLLISPLSNLSRTATTILFLHPRSSITPT